MGWKPAKDALLDGRIDAAATAFSPLDPEWGEWICVSATKEALTISRKPIYLVDLTAEAIKKTAKYYDFALGSHKIPVGVIASQDKAGALKAREGQPDVYGYQISNSFWADASMDPDIVYEIVKLWYEHDKELWEYGGATCRSMRKEFMTLIPLDKSGYHPGAVKFYDQVGLKIGE